MERKTSLVRCTKYLAEISWEVLLKQLIATQLNSLSLDENPMTELLASLSHCRHLYIMRQTRVTCARDSSLSRCSHGYNTLTQGFLFVCLVLFFSFLLARVRELAGRPPYKNPWKIYFERNMIESKMGEGTILLPEPASK